MPSVKKQPWMKFFPADWRADPRLRMCSLAARGLWIEMIGVMHESEPYGHLLIEGVAPDQAAITSLVGRPLKEVRAALAELEAHRVFDRGEQGQIVSRRMVRDKAKADADKANGKGGGNPKLTGHDNDVVNTPDKGGVNPPDKAQILEARELEKKDAAPAAPDADLYRRGKEILGKEAGGLVKKLLKAKQNNIPLARAAIEQASQKANPREYIGAILKASDEVGASARPGFGDEWG